MERIKLYERFGRMFIRCEGYFKKNGGTNVELLGLLDIIGGSIKQEMYKKPKTPKEK